MLVVVALGVMEGDRAASMMTPVGDSAESGARAITVLVDVAVRPVWLVTT
jgi:hypothetical protein